MVRERSLWGGILMNEYVKAFTALMSVIAIAVLISLIVTSAILKYDASTEREIENTTEHQCESTN